MGHSILISFAPSRLMARALRGITRYRTVATAHEKNRKMRDAPSGRSWVARAAAPRRRVGRGSNGTSAMWRAALRLLSSNFQDDLVTIMECMPMLSAELRGSWQLGRRPIWVHPPRPSFGRNTLAYLQRGSLARAQIPDNGSKIRVRIESRSNWRPCPAFRGVGSGGLQRL